MLNIKSLESIKTVAKINGQYILTEIHMKFYTQAPQPL